MTDERGGILLKLLVLLVALCFLAVAYLMRYPMLRAAGGFWVVDEAPQAADAIIILSDDNERGDRASRATGLYQAGWAPVVVASGRYLRSDASIADLMQHDLLARGVPAKAIVKFPHRARNTREEAEVLRGFCEHRGWHRVLVVTSDYHTRRARYIWRRVFPRAIAVRLVAAPDADYDPNAWWRTRGGVKLFFHELVGSAVAIWELRHARAEEMGADFRALLMASDRRLAGGRELILPRARKGSSLQAPAAIL